MYKITILKFVRESPPLFLNATIYEEEKKKENQNKWILQK